MEYSCALIVLEYTAHWVCTLRLSGDCAWYYDCL